MAKSASWRDGARRGPLCGTSRSSTNREQRCRHGRSHPCAIRHAGEGDCETAGGHGPCLDFRPYPARGSVRLRDDAGRAMYERAGDGPDSTCHHHRIGVTESITALMIPAPPGGRAKHGSVRTEFEYEHVAASHRCIGSITRLDPRGPLGVRRHGGGQRREPQKNLDRFFERGFVSS